MATRFMDKKALFLFVMGFLAGNLYRYYISDDDGGDSGVPQLVRDVGGDIYGIQASLVDNVKVKKSSRSPKDGAFYLESEIAKDHENWEEKKCRGTELRSMKDFYHYIDTRTLPCDKPAMFGGIIYNVTPTIVDGEKWICLSKTFNLIYGKCIVYSFGISFDWTFDDAMGQKFECKVFSFDPTINLKDHYRSQNIKFFNLGISDVQATGARVKWKMDRYANIVKMLGHENTTIDYLKIDVEGSERQFFDDVLYKTPNLLKNVKMLSIEIHQEGKSLGPDQRRFWRYFQRLDCLGFKVWYSDINSWPHIQFNYNGKLRSSCYEIVWARDRQW